MKEWLERLRLALGDRQIAYRRVFGGQGPEQQLVLKDLARFCRAFESTMHPDPRMHAMAEGRREVWLRISEHLKMTPDQLWSLYSGRGSDQSQ